MNVDVLVMAKGEVQIQISCTYLIWWREIGIQIHYYTVNFKILMCAVCSGELTETFALLPCALYIPN